MLISIRKKIIQKKVVRKQTHFPRFSNAFYDVSHYLRALEFTDEWQEITAVHVRNQGLGNTDTFGGLVVLENARQSTGSGSQGRVQAVDVLLLAVAHLLDAATDLQVARLVVSAVGARNQLLVGTLEGEPSLQIILLGSSVVQGSRDDRDNAVGETQGLVEVFRVLDHVVKHLPGLLGLSQTELLNLLELVDTEDTPGVATSSSGLLAEAGRVTGVLDGQLLLGLLEPFVGVEGGDGLLRGGDQVHVLVVASNLVELLVELGKLSSLGHGLLLHEVRGLELPVLALAQERETVVDKSHVKLNTGIGQEVAAVGSDLVTTLGIVSTETVEDLVVRVDLGVVLGLLAAMEVSALDNVVVLSKNRVEEKIIVSHAFTHENVLDSCACAFSFMSRVSMGCNTSLSEMGTES